MPVEGLETLLEGLCRVNGQQGGTIHQFFPNNTIGEIIPAERSHRDYLKCGLTFDSRAAFDKLCGMYGLVITWGR